MQIKPRAYPHPVLSQFNDDVVDSVFQPVVTARVTKNKYVFEATFKTNNADLLTLVKDEKALFAVHVECNATRYRNVFTSSTERFPFEIDANLLDAKVDLCSFILAKTRIDNYQNSNFHKDYLNVSFGVQIADTLAVGQDHEFYAEKKADPLRRVSSIFSIVKNDSPNAVSMDIDTNGDKIIVQLSPANFDAYSRLQQDKALQPMLWSLVVVPALVSVLDKLRQMISQGGIDEFADLRWYLVLSNKLRTLRVDLGEDVDSTLKLAQDILGQPVTKSLVDLTKMIAEDGE